MDELYLGEITIAEHNKNATITCHIPSPCQLSLIIQDEKGSSKMEKSYQLEPSDSAFQFNVSNFSNGHYHVWIEVDGKTFLRSFHIVNSEKNENWMDKVKNFFG